MPMRFLPNKPFRFVAKILTASLIGALILFVINMEDSGLSLLIFLLPSALIMWAYTKEKKEDEYIDQVRLEAMQIAIYVNYIILLVSNFLFYSGDFWRVQDINLLTIPIIYIAWFQYNLYRINKQVEAKTFES